MNLKEVKASQKQPTSQEDLEQELLYSRDGSGDTPFDIFMQYSTQKEMLGQKLAGMMVGQKGDSLHMLDVGAGEGELHAKLLKHIHTIRPFLKLDVTFVEPKPNHVENLKGIIKVAHTFLPGGYRGEVKQGLWEQVQADLVGQKFDRILCSHTIYHFAKENFAEYFHQMVDLLTPKGRLYVVARRKDAAYNFIKRFFHEATGRPSNEITIDDARPDLQRVAVEYGLKMREETSHAQVIIPFQPRPEDAEQIVGFFLRTPWAEISEQTRKDILVYLNERHGVLEQLDGIIELSRM